MVEYIRDSLSKAYPDKKAAFEKNAGAYIKKLEALNKEYEDGLANAKQKSFVTQHAAFNYLALDYGLKQVPISGICQCQTTPLPALRAQRISKRLK